MTTETEVSDQTNTAETTQAPAQEPDLRSTIMDAVAQQRAKTAPEQEGAEGAAANDAARARAADGRFAKKPEGGQQEQPKPPEGAQAAQTGQPDASTENQAPKPPPGWSPAAKVAFDKLPPEVKEAVARREVEINQGFAKLAEYKGLEPLADLAKQNGTNIVKAVQEYREFEVKLQSDFMGGIGFICQRFGVNPIALAQAILGRSGSPQQERQANQTAGQQPDISPVLQRLQQLEEREQQREGATLQNEIRSFAEDPKNRFFDNVRPMMAQILRNGQASSIPEAYEAACWLTPDVRAQLISEQAQGSNGAQQAQRAAAAVDQARRQAKAIGGAPPSGVTGSPSKPDPNASIRDTILAAVHAQRGRA